MNRDTRRDSNLGPHGFPSRRDDSDPLETPLDWAAVGASALGLLVFLYLVVIVVLVIGSKP